MIYHTINLCFVKGFLSIFNFILIDRTLKIDKNTNINNYMKVFLS